MSNVSRSSRCAGCKFLRKRCASECILAPYFPSNNPQRFASVHKIFGASNISKMLKRLPVHQRATAADCMWYEAEWRVQDPVYGCVKIIYRLEKEVSEIQLELARTRSEIAFHCAAQQHQQLEQQKVQVSKKDESLWFTDSITGTPFTLQQQLARAQVQEGEPSWLSGSSSNSSERQRPYIYNNRA